MSKQHETLSRLSYAELGKTMTALTDDELVELLNSKSVKVGDTAASLLSTRNRIDVVLQGFARGQVTTRNGKMRVVYIVGRKHNTNAAMDVLMTLVKDRVFDVADSALFAIVKVGGSTVRGKLAELQQSPDVIPSIRPRIERALKAIDENDPRVYSPNFGG